MKTTPEDLELICIPGIHGYEIIGTGEITHLIGEGNQTAIHTTIKPEPYISSFCLKHYEKILSRKFFIRIHKSYIINLKFIHRYIKGKSPYVLLKNKIPLNVSAYYQKMIAALLCSLS
jgi:two-component system LytT family response regulator